MKPNVHVVRILVAFFLVISFAGSGKAAEPKVINVGWTGGSAWTALPFQVARRQRFLRKGGAQSQVDHHARNNLDAQRPHGRRS